jgi:hypothetical protein
MLKTHEAAAARIKYIQLTGIPAPLIIAAGIVIKATTTLIIKVKSHELAILYFVENLAITATIPEDIAEIHA